MQGIRLSLGRGDLHKATAPRLMDLRRLRSEIAAVRQWQGQGGQGDPSDLYRAFTASPRHAAVGAEPKAEAEADRSILRDISAQRRRVLAMRDVSRCESRSASTM